jgi:hypothetical protein
MILILSLILPRYKNSANKIINTSTPESPIRKYDESLISLSVSVS